MSDVEIEPTAALSQLELDSEASKNELQILRDQTKKAKVELVKKEEEMKAIKEAAATLKEISDKKKIEELEINLMHQSIETPAPRTPGLSGDLTRP